MIHDELIEKWSSIFTNEKGDQVVCYLEIPENWYNLVDTLCHQIVGYLKQNPDACPFYVVQVKEKFGGLRFYVEGGDEYIQGLIAMSEAYSYHL